MTQDEPDDDKLAQGETRPNRHDGVFITVGDREMLAQEHASEGLLRRLWRSVRTTFSSRKVDR